MLDETLECEERRSKLTHSQLQGITDMLADPWQNLGPERVERLQTLRKHVQEEFFPEPPDPPTAHIV